MLDRKSRKVLKKTIKLQKRYDKTNSYKIYFHDDDIKSLNMSFELLGSICKDLEQKGYFEEVCIRYDDIFVILPYKGLSYFTYRRMHIKSKLIDILISFLITAVTVANWDSISAFFNKLLTIISGN